jgi:hypothetical protein
MAKTLKANSRFRRLRSVAVWPLIAGYLALVVAFDVGSDIFRAGSGCDRNCERDGACRPLLRLERCVHRLASAGARQSRKHMDAIFVDLVTLPFYS